MTKHGTQAVPPAIKRSRAKIWLRTAILAVFGTFFALALHRDIALGGFHWSWALMAFLPCLAIAFWISRLVPTQVHPASKHVTLSFDFIYFALILFLVVAKTMACVTACLLPYNELFRAPAASPGPAEA